MKKIKVNGTWLSEDHDIQRGVVRAFQNLLSDPGGWCPCLNSLEFDSIGVEETAMLEMFSVKEVSSALSELNGDKALVRMGFPLHSGNSAGISSKMRLWVFSKIFLRRENLSEA